MIELVFAAGMASILFSLFLARGVLAHEKGNEKMEQIAAAIRTGANSYLKRQYKTIAVFAVAIAALLYAFINTATAVTFVAGAALSALAGYAGMQISVRANVKTAAAAKNGLEKALNVAVKGGAVTGMFVAGIALLGLASFYQLYNDPFTLIGLGFGASLISLFARVGGGIYTKAADVGADLVGKLEAGIPEDDPRNPAVIADNVGDNVGDCAGMAADLFETYVVSALGAMLLGNILGFSAETPLLMGAAAIAASMVGVYAIRTKDKIMRALYAGLIVSALLSAVAFYFILTPSLFYASAVGLTVSLLLFGATEYYTSEKHGPVRYIADSSKTGAATTMIAGISVGMQSTALPILIVTAGMLAAYYIAGLYGIAIAVMAMLSLIGMVITMDAYGPITDNAGGIAEMAGLDKKIREVTDKLDAVGYRTKAVTKAFAIGSAALAALTLFATYVMEVNKAGANVTFALNDPLVLAGLFIGGLIPFLFSAMTMTAVGKAAFGVVEEVRAQFKKGILEGKASPDYGRCVDIVTSSALKEMAMPGILSVTAPVAIGLVLGPVALGGLLMGCIVTGFLMAIMMTNSGGAWDNAKKYIEAGAHGGKGSDAHKAAVVGDTVGDPYKDTSGPAINPLIKVMNIIAILLVPVMMAMAR
ncbi:MAG: sodium-translocating pyrophosphatase [Candidatus Aenigmarchaeota archaeon]|nr:sodium-translocating pyrophosphatase [Candidatus Aenigmarchaeota archaeon]